uniref:DDE_3 domain-containing protein n=1 Tax=Strongyloides papillosus TaxID=174720 RepID=A0A0N5B7P0_STREA
MRTILFLNEASVHAPHELDEEQEEYTRGQITNLGKAEKGDVQEPFQKRRVLTTPFRLKKTDIQILLMKRSRKKSKREFNNLKLFESRIYEDLARND